MIERGFSFAELKSMGSGSRSGSTKKKETKDDKQISLFHPSL